MSEEKENRILSDMRKIEGIVDYWDLQRLLAVQFYSTTKDPKYLGYADLAKHMLINISKRSKEEEQPLIDNGYESTI